MAQVIRKSVFAAAVLSFLSISFAPGFAKASQKPIRYEGSFESKGEDSNTGETYYQRFNIVVQFIPNEEITGNLKEGKTQTCNYVGDAEECSSSASYSDVCVSYLKLNLGQVRIEIRNPISGETQIQTVPWTAYKSDRICGLDGLFEGESISGHVRVMFDLKSVAPGTKRSLYFDIEPWAAGFDNSDYAMVSTLYQIKGKNRVYSVEPFSPKLKETVFWEYSHKIGQGVGEIWGESGNMTLNLKN